MDGLLERMLSAGVAEEDAHTDVLDAAYELFCRQGIQHTSMDDIAKRAGLSRITVYRRLASKEALVEQVVLREFRRYVDQFLAEIAHADTVTDRLAIGFVSALRALKSNPLVEGLMRTEPDTIVPAITGEGGSTLTVAAHFLSGQLRREQAAGNIAPTVDVDLVGELMVRLCASLFLTPSKLVDLDDEAQLDRIARRYLAPMLSD